MNLITPEFALFADDNELIEQITYLNAEYRKGTPKVSDQHFDSLYAELERRLPKHPLVAKVQTALFDGKGRIFHPELMLSTEKA